MGPRESGGGLIGGAFLVTGTDTGVGKTAVSCGILLALRRAGVDVGAFKPAESGHAVTNGTWPPDGRALSRAAGLDADVHDVVPFTFRNALAPAVASRLERRPIHVSRMDAAFQRMKKMHALTLVEGAGGLAVPITRRHTVAHLARRWDLPLVVVARPGLGTLNHTFLTIDHARGQGLDVLGVIINRFPRRPGAAERTNPQEMERLTGVRVLGRVPEAPGVDVDGGRIEEMAKMVERHVDLGPIRRLVRTTR